MSGNFSFNWTVPVVIKDYEKNDSVKFEVEFLGHPMKIEHFKSVLAKYVKGLAFWHDTPKFSGEVKRMKVQTGKAKFKGNDPRVLARKNLVQEVRGAKKPSNGVFWDDKPQIVRLPVKVEENPTMETCLIRWGGRNGIVGHNQYYMVVRYVLRVAKVRIRKEKGPRITLFDDLSSNLEDSDINEDKDEDKDEDDGFSMAGVSID